MGYKSLAQIPARRNGPVSSNVRQRRLHSFRVHFGRSIIFASSRIRKSLTAPHHFGQCPNTLKALRAGALRRAVSFGGMCLNRGRFTGLAYNACELCSQCLVLIHGLLISEAAFVSTHSRWLALRAGVLRRAVSWATSPVISLRCACLSSGACEVCPGHLSFGAPQVLLQQLHLVRITIRLGRNFNQQLARSLSRGKFKIPLPNHSLNRTLHSLSAFGLKKPSPNAANLFRAG